MIYIPASLQKIAAFAFMILVAASVAITVFRFSVLMPVDASKALSQAHEGLMRSKRAIDTAENRQQELESLRSQAASIRLLKGTGPQIRLQLQSIIRQLAARSGVRINNMQDAGLESLEGGYHRAGVRMAGQANYAAVVAFLSGLESHPSLPVVSELTLTARRRAGQPSSLSVQMVVKLLAEDGGRI